MGTLLEGLFFAPTEWLLILIVVLLMFGGKKIPELMKGLGSGIRNFKEAIKDDEEVPKPENTTGASSPGPISENSETKKTSAE
jgi:sec-independent protein translocase protein TatA